MAFFEHDDDRCRVRQLRSLVILFTLYSCVLLFALLFVSDGAHVGSILFGLAGHATLASARSAMAWREASWLDAVRSRVLRRQLA